MSTVSSGSSDVVSPFGGFPSRVARGVFANLQPFLAGLGLGRGREFDRIQRGLDSGDFQGPSAGLLRFLQGDIVPQSLTRSSEIGQTLAREGQGQYDAFRDQVQNLLAGLPGQREATERLRQRAFDPLQGEDLFRVASRRLQQGVGEQAALAGAGTSGAAGQALTDATRDLVTSLRANRFNEQLQSLQAGAAQQGVERQALDAIAQQGQQLQLLGAALSQEFGLPLQQAQALLQLLTSGTGPGTALVGATAPGIGQSQQSVRVL